MAYDEELADRIRDEVEGEPRLTEQKMFGGLAFLVGGHMAVAASGQGGLMLRCDPDETEALLASRARRSSRCAARRCGAGCASTPSAVSDDDALAAWVARGTAYARSLPPKD